LPDSLLLVSIGPVQGFISAGRRGQDLWAGSQLLSDLAREVAVTLAEGRQNTLIFPGDLGQGEGDHDPPSVANKILVRLRDGQDPQVAAAKAEAQVDEWLEAQFDRHFGGRSRWLDLTRAHDQILGTGQGDGMLEVLWAALPLADEAAYATTRKALEGLLAARKNTRNWGPVTWGAHVPKSPIDGERETVVLEEVFKRVRTTSDQDQRAAEHQLRRTLGIEPEETLDGPGMLKRLRQLQRDDDLPRIHGTAHMAASPVLQRIALRNAAGRTDGDAPVRTYVDRLTELGIDLKQEARIRVQAPDHATLDGLSVPRAFLLDGHVGYDGLFFFEGQLEKLSGCLIAKTPKKPEDVLPEARAALRKCLGELGLSGGPTPYYALLLADGDHMGRALDELSAHGIEAHQRFSVALELQFAQACRATIAKVGGSLIYAGGDDVLALVPLHTVLTAVTALRDLFDGAIRGALKDNGIENPPTLSVGVALCHHLDPLFDARQLASRAEKLAKNGKDGLPGRNALALIMDKRSGSTVELFGTFTETPGLIERLESWITHLDRGDLPDGVAFELEEALRPFEIADSARQPAESAHQGRDAAIQALVKRILGRKRDKDGQPLAQSLIKLLDEARAHTHLDALQATRRLSHEIQVARLLLRARRDARIDAPQGGNHP